MNFLAYYFLFMSFLTLALFGLDKAAAILGRRRVAERTLHILSVLGGWPGACLGRVLFRHKTRKKGFTHSLYAAVIVNVVAVLTVLHWILNERP